MSTETPHFGEVTRRHPDLFTAAEALEYLHKSPDDGRFLKTCRDSHGLVGHMFGKEMMYQRLHLDALVLRLCGRSPFDAIATLDEAVHFGVSCVYLLMVGNACVYIGKTTDLKTRLRDHRRDRKRYERVRVFPVGEALMSRLEAALIARFRPPLNETHPRPVEVHRPILEHFGFWVEPTSTEVQ